MERVLLVRTGLREMRKNANLDDREREKSSGKNAGKNGKQEEMTVGKKREGKTCRKCAECTCNNSPRLNHNERMLLCYLGVA